MPLSARNQLRGQVKSVKLGSVVAHVVVQVGENEIECAITRRKAEELNLRPGEIVTAVIKPTNVLLKSPEREVITAGTKAMWRLPGL